MKFSHGWYILFNSRDFHHNRNPISHLSLLPIATRRPIQKCDSNMSDVLCTSDLVPTDIVCCYVTQGNLWEALRGSTCPLAHSRDVASLEGFCREKTQFYTLVGQNTNHLKYEKLLLSNVWIQPVSAFLSISQQESFSETSNYSVSNCLALLIFYASNEVGHIILRSLNSAVMR